MRKFRIDKNIMKINWFSKLLMHWHPAGFFRLAAREQGVAYDKVEASEKLFRDAKRVDFQPSGGSNGRGLIITIDNNLSLFFCQDGNTFSYDGFEMGPYENGEVTVFDKLSV